MAPHARQDVSDLDVAHHRQDRVSGVVVAAVEVDQVPVADRRDVTFPADRVVAVGMGEKDRRQNRV